MAEYYHKVHYDNFLQGPLKIAAAKRQRVAQYAIPAHCDRNMGSLRRMV